MTAGRTAGAASRARVPWQAIAGQPGHQHVRRLQGRLVKACQAGRWGQGPAWPRLLPHARSGSAIAGQRRTAKPGTRTPGRDGTLWDTPAKQAQALHPRRQRGSRPTPLRRVSSPHSHGQKRPRGIGTMQDRALQV
jgi:RNA-directed DNA polymerase